MNIEEVKEVLVEHYDPDQVCFMLDLKIEDLVDRFEEKIGERYDFILNEITSDGYVLSD